MAQCPGNTVAGVQNCPCVPTVQARELMPELADYAWNSTEKQAKNVNIKKFAYFILLHAYEHFASVNVGVLRACLVPVESRGRHQILWNSCDLLYRCWKLNLDPRKEKPSVPSCCSISLVQDLSIFKWHRILSFCFSCVLACFS